jgi:transposase-like protein
MAMESMEWVGRLMQQAFKDPEGMKLVLSHLSQAAMEHGVSQQLQAQRHERQPARRGYRNGYKHRELLTRIGRLELRVPQVRGCEPYHPGFFERYQRSERALLVACGEMYVQGVSTRRVQEVLEVMCGGEISAMTISRISAELDEKLKAFRGRWLGEQAWPYLMIDARYEKVRVEGQVVSQAVLVVAGINEDGRKQVLDWRIGDSESEATWGELFQSLKERGLRGLRLLVSDAHSGIRAAARRQFQGVAWQRCQVHFARELCGKVSYRQRAQMMRELRCVLRSDSEQEALRLSREMACRWSSQRAVVRMLEEGLPDCLTVQGIPRPIRYRLATTNLLENVMKMLKHRTVVVGVFPSRQSCDRLVGAVLLEVHERWLMQNARSMPPLMNAKVEEVLAAA